MNKVILMGRLTRDPEMRNSNGESNTATEILGHQGKRESARR